MSRKSSRYRVRFHRSVKSRITVQERIVQNRLQNVPTRNIAVYEPNSDDGIVEKSLRKIREWAITHNITQHALSDLLKILPSFGVSWLPLDARTVMKTPRNIELVECANGKLWYNGLRNNIQRIFEFVGQDFKLELNFNIDGIPLYNSSKKEFWPILANVHSMYLFNIQKQQFY